MDFEGQRLAEQLLIKLLVAFAAASFLLGYASANFALMAYINAAGLAITTLLVVPDWPFFRKHPFNWLPPLNPGQQQATAAATPATKSRKQG